MKICSVFGHRDFIITNNKAKKIKKELVLLIENNGIDTFYLGGIGAFDIFCADCIKSIKDFYPKIKSYLILAYLDQKYNEYQKASIDLMYDGTIFPPLEKVPKAYAILMRNYWMMDKCDCAFFYVDRSWGGARKMLDYGIKKDKLYINIANKDI